MIAVSLRVVINEAIDNVVIAIVMCEVCNNFFMYRSNCFYVDASLGLPLVLSMRCAWVELRVKWCRVEVTWQNWRARRFVGVLGAVAWPERDLSIADSRQKKMLSHSPFWWICIVLIAEAWIGVFVRYSNARVVDAVEIRWVDKVAHTQSRHHSIKTVASFKVLRRTICAAWTNRSIYLVDGNWWSDRKSISESLKWKQRRVAYPRILSTRSFP